MKIICIGRNYVAHARELNNEVPDKTGFFYETRFGPGDCQPSLLLSRFFNRMCITNWRW